MHNKAYKPNCLKSIKYNTTNENKSNSKNN